MMAETVEAQAPLAEAEAIMVEAVEAQAHDAEAHEAQAQVAAQTQVEVVQAQAEAQTQAVVALSALPLSALVESDAAESEASRAPVRRGNGKQQQQQGRSGFKSWKRRGSRVLIKSADDVNGAAAALLAGLVPLVRDAAVAAVQARRRWFSDSDVRTSACVRAYVFVVFSAFNRSREAPNG